MAKVCMNCQHFSFKEAGQQIANLAFGACKKAGVGEYKSATYPRECEKFADAGKDSVEKRVAFLQKILAFRVKND